MRIAILGGRGAMGAKVAQLLEERGHSVTTPSRASGVDARTGQGLREAFAGVDAVVDALNHQGMKAQEEREFFGAAARNVAQAAKQAGVKRVVVVSIAGASDPAVHAKHGYYAGKAAQESAYLESGVPVTIIHSAQWYELVDQMIKMIPLGPFALLPTMRISPVSSSAVAGFVAATVEEDLAAVAGVEGEGSGARTGARTGAGAAGAGGPSLQRCVAIRGPEEATTARFARRILEARGSVGGRRPKVFWELPLFGRGIASGGLIPTGQVVGLPGLLSEPVTTDPTTVEQWAR